MKFDALLFWFVTVLQLQSELVASKTLVQKLESELETLKSNWDKEQKNMDAMVTARDKVNGEKQKLADEINRIREEHLKTVRFLTHRYLMSARTPYKCRSWLECISCTCVTKVNLRMMIESSIRLSHSIK